MKIPIHILLGFCLATSLKAQQPADSPPATRRTAAELAELLGPIALYPDALIALILPASTYPSDIVLGARYVATGGNPARVEDKPWDSSVKALTRYPDTLKWLDENLEWTAQVGDTFIEQPVEVMESIQQLRAKARALGNLVDTPQQRIVQEETYIRIIPAQPEFIYEPRYDPDVIYYERPLLGPLLFFSIGYGVGSWLNYDCDWHRHSLYRGDWHEGWDYSRERRQRDSGGIYYINNNLTNSREWRPDTDRRRTQSRQMTERAISGASSLSRTQSGDLGGAEPRDHHKGITRPKPIAGAPHHGKTVKRTESADGRKTDLQSDTRTAHDSKSKDGRDGKVTTPKTNAPGITNDSKKDRDGRDQTDHKNKGDSKNGDIPSSVTRHPETPSKDNAENKPRVDDPPKHKSTKVEEPRRKDVPKHDDAPKHEEPRKKDMFKQDAPPSKHQDTSKRDEPKRDAPKQEAAKPHAEPTSDKSKKSDKKKDEDKDKKKQ